MVVLYCTGGGEGGRVQPPGLQQANGAGWGWCLLRDMDVEHWPTDSKETSSWGCASSLVAIYVVGHIHL